MVAENYKSTETDINSVKDFLKSQGFDYKNNKRQ